MRDIKLTEDDVLRLLITLEGYIQAKTVETESVKMAQESGLKTSLFDDYTDYYAALDAQQKDAKRLMRHIQEQTGMHILTETAIGEL
jgi:hypothetical protein